MLLRGVLGHVLPDLVTLLYCAVAATTYTYRLRAQGATDSSAWTETTITTPSTTVQGLAGVYHDNADLTGTSIDRVDSMVNFNWTTGVPVTGIGADRFSVRWARSVTSTTSVAWTFYANTDDGARLWVNGVQLVNAWTNQSAENSGSITLTRRTRTRGTTTTSWAG